MMESTEVRKWVTHMLCWTWAMYFSAAASSENDQGSMNFASNTASVPSTIPSSVAAIQGIAECFTRRWTLVTRLPLSRSYQLRLSSSVAAPSWTMGLPDKSSGSTSPRFSRHRRASAASSLPMMIRASEPPMNQRRSELVRVFKRGIPQLRIAGNDAAGIISYIRHVSIPQVLFDTQGIDYEEFGYNERADSRRQRAASLGAASSGQGFFCFTPYDQATRS